MIPNFDLQDLGHKDLLRDSYLIAHIYKIGSLRDESKKAPTRHYKRPYGCGGKQFSDIHTS